MPTTGSNFIQVNATTLLGSTVTTAPYLQSDGPKECMVQTQPTQPVGGSGSPIATKSVIVDRVAVDLSLTVIPATGTPPLTPECLRHVHRRIRQERLGPARLERHHAADDQPRQHDHEHPAVNGRRHRAWRPFTSW